MTVAAMSSRSWLVPAPRASDEDDGTPNTGTSLPNTKKRKTHQKSRTGCRTCKTRKIKCDEAEPECSQCQRFGVACDFLPPFEWEQRVSQNRSEQAKGARRLRGRPRSDWTTRLPLVHSQSSSSRNQAASATASPGGVSQSVSSSPEGLNADDLLLLHHYTTVTAGYLGHIHLWRDSVPKLGRDYPGVLHAVLSISAYHLARTDLQRTPKHLLQAERHYELAVRDATSMMANLTIENCQAFYALAVLICFDGFAKGPSPGEMMLVARDGRTSQLSLIHGVRMVLETFGPSVIYSGFLAVPEPSSSEPSEDPHIEREARQERARRVEVVFPGWDWRVSLTRLRDSLPDEATSEKARSLKESTSGMLRCFECVCETLPPAAERKVEDFIKVMQWVYTFDGLFIQALNELDQTALILVGHYGVLLEVLEGYWFLDGWGKHILRELQEMLGSEYREWLPRV